jgi:hypothetical protein
MALIDGLSAIGDAIREKTGGTDLIPFLDMPEAIRSISGGSTPQPENVPNPLKYATQLDTVYMGAAFPENYELTLNVPYVKSLGNAFNGARNIKKLTLIGNTAENLVSFNRAFRSCLSIEIIDLTEFNAKPSTIDMASYSNSALREILGEIDFSECTNMNSAFQGCTNLEKITPKANSIKISIGFPSSSKLSATSIQSIIDGLATVETAQTLTLPKKFLNEDAYHNYNEHFLLITTK